MGKRKRVKVMAELRQGKDDDIKAALEESDKLNDRSDVIRAALRLYFNLGGRNILNEVLVSNTAKPSVPTALNLGDVTLEKTKKDAEEIDAELDNLLGDF